MKKILFILLAGAGLMACTSTDKKINESGKLFLSHTKLNGKFVIRLTIGSIRHEKRNIVDAWELIKNTSIILI